MRIIVREIIRFCGKVRFFVWFFVEEELVVFKRGLVLVFAFWKVIFKFGYFV